MKRAPLVALFALLFACLPGDEGTPVHGTEVGVIVHNYALAFREFLHTAESEARLPAYAIAPLPIADDEWHADDAAHGAQVTTTTANTESASTVACSADVCERQVRVTYRDGFKLDEDKTIWYWRSDTTTTDDDAILGFETLVRYRDETVSRTAATEPTAGEPWVVTTEFGFIGEDFREAFFREQTFPELTSAAAAQKVRLKFATKDALAEGEYARTGAQWAYAHTVSYESYSRLKSLLLEVSAAEKTVRTLLSLNYANGVAVHPIDVSGSLDSWQLGGDTVAAGAISGSRDPQGWMRRISFPSGSRFRSLSDTGSYTTSSDRGTFTREIVGLSETLTLEGTYTLKAPGVWEIRASGEGGLRMEFTYQSLDLSDVFQGFWVQRNSRSSNQDTGEFTIQLHPDWTTRMNYTYNRADTPFTPDESGALVFLPDSRGAATVSVVQEKAGEVQHHKDYRLRIVAEGQQP